MASSQGSSRPSARGPAVSTAVASASASPAWDAVVGRIVFESSRKPAGLYVMAADGTGLQRIPGADSGAAPEWSPDGSRIAFVGSGNALVVIASDGTGAVTLQHLPGEAVNALSWRPDGRAIVYVAVQLPAGDVGQERLSLVDVDGGAPMKLTDQTSGDRPAWSPDGGSILFSAGCPLVALRLADHTTTQLTNPPADQCDANGAWSPDGRRIAFDRQIELADGSAVSHLFVADLGAGTVAQVTSGSGTEQGATWSPDGAWIAYGHWDAEGHASIWRVRPDGSEDVKVADPGTASDFAPSWAR